MELKVAKSEIEKTHLCLKEGESIEVYYEGKAIEGQSPILVVAKDNKLVVVPFSTLYEGSDNEHQYSPKGKAKVKNIVVEGFVIDMWPYDPTVNPEDNYLVIFKVVKRQEDFAYGAIRWEGCMNIISDNVQHVCGLEEIIKLYDTLYRMAAEIMPHHEWNTVEEGKEIEIRELKKRYEQTIENLKINNNELMKQVKKMNDERNSYKSEWEWEQKKRIKAEDELSEVRSKLCKLCANGQNPIICTKCKMNPKPMCDNPIDNYKPLGKVCAICADHKKCHEEEYEREYAACFKEK